MSRSKPLPYEYIKGKGAVPRGTAPWLVQLKKSADWINRVLTLYTGTASGEVYSKYKAFMLCLVCAFFG